MGEGKSFKTLSTHLELDRTVGSVSVTNVCLDRFKSFLTYICVTIAK